MKQLIKVYSQYKMIDSKLVDSSAEYYDWMDKKGYFNLLCMNECIVKIERVNRTAKI